MPTFNSNKLLFFVSSFLISTNLAAANEVSVLENKYKDQKKYFEMIGQEFTARKDNQYIIDKFGVNNPLMNHHALLKKPDIYNCSKSYCERKAISENQSFKIERIVEPAIKEDKGFGDNVCDKNVIFCYYKLVFKDKDVAYIRVADLLDAQNPTRAYVGDAQPWKLQVIPSTPSASWKKEKKQYDKHFKKSGVSLGYTKIDVLNSHWGKPQFKTKSSSIDMDIEIWSYNGGQLSFIDGYVTDITTSN